MRTIVAAPPSVEPSLLRITPFAGVGRRRARVVCGALLLVVAGACGGQAPTAPTPVVRVPTSVVSAPTPVVAGVNGTYGGTATRPLATVNGVDRFALEMTLRQDGTAITGTGNVVGWGFGPYPVTGTAMTSGGTTTVTVRISATDFDYMIRGTSESGGQSIVGELFNCDFDTERCADGNSWGPITLTR